MPFENATPRPWKSFSTYIYAPGERGGNVCACSEPRATTEVSYTSPDIASPDLEEAHANAELIVTAVNAHEALVEALEAVIPFLPIGFASTSRPGASEDRNAALQVAREKANAALKLARAET